MKTICAANQRLSCWTFLTFLLQAVAFTPSLSFMMVSHAVGSPSQDEVVLTEGQVPYPEVVFDISEDFSIASNPNGVWTYGYQLDLGGALTPVTFSKTFSSDNGVPIADWQFSNSEGPTFARNMGTTTAISAAGAFVGPPGTVWFTPGPESTTRNFGVIRFIAPVGMTNSYLIRTSVQSLFDGAISDDCDFHVLQNGTELFGESLAPNSSTGYTNQIDLQVGDTVDFVIGRGADGILDHSGLKIQASLVTHSANPLECIDPPPGLVGWWPLEGDGQDVVGHNHGSLVGSPVFGPGQVGEGMIFDGVDDEISMPASSSLDVGLGDGLTVEAWINPSTLSQPRPIFEWSNRRGLIGVALWLSQPPSAGGGPGSLFANIVEANNTSHWIPTAGGIVSSNQWQHIALTYARGSGTGTIYVNGLVVTQKVVGSFTAQTSFDLFFGRRAALTGEAWFAGQMDELSLYNRALTASEVHNIYQAGAAGKCFIPQPPSIHTQPESTLVSLGASASFSVVAFGTAPLSYQWHFNGTDLPDQTGPTLTVENVQVSDEGDYTVTVSNDLGSVTSDPATLTVEKPPPSETVYNIAADFSPDDNPNGVWSYGWVETLEGPFNLLTVPHQTTTGEGATITSWQLGSSQPPAVHYNGSEITATSDDGQGVYPPGTLWVAPGLDGHPENFVAIRFTVPSGQAGIYHVEIAARTYLDGDLSGDSDFHVVHNGMELFGEFVPGNSATGYTNDLELAEGDTIDFLTGRGTDGMLFASGLKIAGTINRMVGPEDCVSPPTGLVGWWPLEGDGQDVIGDNHGSLVGSPVFAPGKVGEGMIFDGVDDEVNMPASASLDVGLGDGFTVEAWINPSTVSEARPIFEWSNRKGLVGVSLWLSLPPSAGGGPGSLFANLAERNNTSHWIPTVGGILSPNQWQHVALTYSRETGIGTIYVNGLVVTQKVVGSFTSQTSFDLFFGRRAALTGEAWFAGQMDELSLYNRPLSASEVHNVYQAGAAGKCFIPQPPSILTQPQSTFVGLGASASFTVVALGTPPLSYQWQFNGTDLPDQTGSTLTLDNVQASDEGDYTVTVSNDLGSVTSDPATLTLIFPPTIVTQPQGRTILEGEDVTFEVAAAGTEPFSYQWLYNGSPLEGATDARLSLSAVPTSAAGDYSVEIANDAGSVLSEPATLVVLTNLGRALLIENVQTSLGESVQVPVYLLAQGNENALGFSLLFDPALLTPTGAALSDSAADASLNLNMNDADAGRLGLTLAMPAGVSFAEGTQAVVTVTFLVDSGSGAVATPLTFGDQPVQREVSDPDAETLETTYVGGFVIVEAGYEADVAPVPDGNNQVTITDWVKVGRYAAGLDDVPNATQFQRADCAPRSTRGNGAITVSDWVQAGRYAADMDPWMPAGGPREPVDLGGGGGGSASLQAAASVSSGRTIRIPGTNLEPGQTLGLPVNLMANGDESALGFSLDFDVSQLRYAGATVGEAAKGASFNVNTNRLNDGQLGLALSLPIGTSFASGTQQVAVVRFTAMDTATGTTSLAFDDTPILREISDPYANPLNANYQSGELTLLPQLHVTKTDDQIILSWSAVITGYTLEVSEGLSDPMTWETVSGTPNQVGDQWQVQVPATGGPKFFRLQQSE
jgi:Concanavalin A-like lectin/glucanases superfamily/Immunoglobulin domain/Cohesin domain